MKKYFVSSDIHSFYKEWMDALKENGFDKNNKEHILIVLGDLLDRGKEPQKIIEFVKEIGDRCILIRGNHEDLFEMMIKRGYVDPIDIHNGTYDTMIDLFHPNGILVSWEEYIESDLYKYVNSKMIDYYETRNYLFTHGFIPIKQSGEYDNDWRKRDTQSFMNARWMNGMEYGEAEVSDIYKLGKRIVCGHYSVGYGHRYFEGGSEYDFSIFHGKYVTCLDGTTVLSNKVNVIVLTEDDLYGEYYQRCDIVDKYMGCSIKDIPIDDRVYFYKTYDEKARDAFHPLELKVTKISNDLWTWMESD